MGTSQDATARSLASLQRYAKSLLRRKEKQRPQNLDTVPNDILALISEYLTPAEKASMALTTKSTLETMGRRCLQLPPDPLYDLLLLIDRDPRSTPDTLCPVCRVFHHPKLSLRPSTRPCVEPDPFPPDWKVTSPYLPQNAHFNIIKAIMQSHRHGQKFLEPDLLSSKEYFKGDASDAKISRITTAVIGRGDKLILRTVVNLYPGRGLRHARYGVPDVLKILVVHSQLDQCCAHVKWTEAYPFIFIPGTVQYKLDHKTKDVWNAKVATTGPNQWSYARQRVKTCLRCHTSYMYLIRNLPHDGGKVVSLVSFKDLGRAKNVHDPKWRSHMCHQDPNKEPRVNRHPWGIEYAFSKRKRVVTGYGLTLDPWCFDGLDDRHPFYRPERSSIWRMFPWQE